MKKYDVSIVIPCYNASKYIKESIDSVLNQDYDKSKIELILINDGSTDNTLEILNKYKSDNIVIIDKQNEGVSKTRNIGIESATGRYILFLDSDDKLSKNALSILVPFFDKNYDNVDLITYPIMFFYPNGREVMHSRYKKQFNKGTGIYDLTTNYELVQATINVMIKNDKTVKFDINQRYSEDEQFNTKILMKKKKIGYVDNIYYYYRRHNESVTSKKHSEDFEKVYEFHNVFLNEYNNHPYIQSIIMNNMRWRVKEHCIYPNNLSNQEINNYIKKMQPRLSKIDYSLFNKEDYIDKKTLLEIIALSGIDCYVENNNLVYNNKILMKNIESYNYITKIVQNKDYFTIYGKIQTPYFYNNNVKVYSTLNYKDGKKETSEIELLNDIEYKNKFEHNYILKISNNLKEINFSLKVNDSECVINTKATKWCSKRKIYGKYQVFINDNIKIRNKNITDYFFNKFVKCKNIKFYIIEFLSIFEKRKIIYYGNKDSKLYQLYLEDNSKNKIFISNNAGNKYKKLILKAKKIVTDQSFDNVIPFGFLTTHYIQASSFTIDEVEI